MKIRRKAKEERTAPISVAWCEALEGRTLLSAIPGLTNGATYQVQVLSPTNLKLSAQVDFTSTGFGSQLFIPGSLLIDIANIDTANDIVTTSAPHGLTNGQLVSWNQNGGVVPGGIIASGAAYLVQVLSPTTLKLFSPTLDLTGNGSGINILTPNSQAISIASVD